MSLYHDPAQGTYLENVYTCVIQSYLKQEAYAGTICIAQPLCQTGSDLSILLNGEGEQHGRKQISQQA